MRADQDISTSLDKHLNRLFNIRTYIDIAIIIEYLPSQVFISQKFSDHALIFDKI
jgi:hypothetical protein